MEFMTGYYRQKEESTALLLQQYVCSGMPVCLGCICGGESSDAGIAGGTLTGRLLAEFRRFSMSKAVKSSGFLKRMERKLYEIRESCIVPSEFWMAGILCVGGSFLLFSEGKVKIVLCNTVFGRPTLQKIGADDRGEQHCLRFQWGDMESEIGILLASRSFYGNLPQEDMQNCLAVKDIHDSGQTQKRIRELGMAAKRRGGRNMAALLLEVRQVGRETSRIVHSGKGAEETERSTGESRTGQGRVNRGEPGRPERSRQGYDDYHFGRVIGEGAFSRVYLTEDGAGQSYACKVSREVKILEREAEILSRLHHPLFPAYAGYGEREGEGRLVMEYIPGRSLGQLVRLRGRLSLRQVMRIAEELADGLRYLHERQPAVLYRDLKPENIMVCENGHIKVIDFGCACYQDAQGRVKVGTPGFAPPEQTETGGIAGIYSDVYSLGKTVQCLMPENRMRNRGKCSNEDKRCRRRLEHMIEEATREDYRLRPQDMITVSQILTGKWEKAGETVCEKNIWESSHKNSCSLPLI